MARNFFPLAAPNPGNQQIDFSAPMNALEGLRQQNNLQGQVKRQQEEQTYQRGRESKQDARQDEQFQMQRQEALGKRMYAFSQLPPERRDPRIWGALVQEHQKYNPGDGMDPDDLDPIAGPNKFGQSYAAAFGGIARDPREDKLMDLKLRGAEADLAEKADERARRKTFDEMLLGGGSNVQQPAPVPAEGVARFSQPNIAQQPQSAPTPASMVANLPPNVQSAVKMLLAAGDRQGAIDLIQKNSIPAKKSVTEMKQIYSSDDEVTTLSNTIKALDDAAKLISPEAEAAGTAAFEGTGSGIAGIIGSRFPGGNLLFDENRSKATDEYGAMMSFEAIKAMADTLKGATTDFELNKFVEILADPSQPREIRRRTMGRMRQLAQDRLNLAKRRSEEIRTGDYYRNPNGVSSPSSAVDIGGGFTMEIE
jgi:hypothetical protein